MIPSLKRRIIEWFCDVFGHKNEYSHTYAGEKHYFCKRCGRHTGVSLTRQEKVVLDNLEELEEEMDSMHRTRDPDRNLSEWFIIESEALEAIDRLDKLGVLRGKQK